jgi:hypothetical protein
MAGCSICVVMMCARLRFPAKNSPFRARLLDSLPPLVKTISSGAQPSRAATCPRPVSTAARAGRPAQWLLDGLPKPSSSIRCITAATPGAIGVLAL